MCNKSYHSSFPHFFFFFGELGIGVATVIVVGAVAGDGCAVCFLFFLTGVNVPAFVMCCVVGCVQPVVEMDVVVYVDAGRELVPKG